MKKLTLVIGIIVGVLLGQTGHSVAQDQPLARLVKLVTDKGYAGVSFGMLCKRFIIRIEWCKGYQVVADDEDPRPSFNTLKDDQGIDWVIIAIHDSKSGFAYFTNPTGKLQNAARGLKDQPDDPNNKEWNWDLIAISDQVRTDYRKQYDYWKSNEAEIAAIPDRDTNLEFCMSMKFADQTPRSVAVIANDSGDYAEAAKKYRASNFQDLPVIYKHTLPPNAESFNTIARAAQASGADVVMVCSGSHDDWKRELASVGAH
jgi:hypothetical protein